MARRSSPLWAAQSVLMARSVAMRLRSEITQPAGTSRTLQLQLAVWSATATSGIMKVSPYWNSRLCDYRAGIVFCCCLTSQQIRFLNDSEVHIRTHCNGKEGEVEPCYENAAMNSFVLEYASRLIQLAVP